MKLLTKEIKARLPKLYATDKVDVEDKMIQVKFFHPASAATWYIAEGQEEDGDFMFFGCCDLFGDGGEWGYVMLSELESVVVRGLRIERDLYFTPKKFSEIKGN